MIPLISVIIPMYNMEHCISRAINSVLGQTVTNFELLIVNDGSLDDGSKVVKSYNDRRIRFFEQENCGVSVARNRGVAEAVGELVAFLDADDEWKPDFLETILRLRNNFPGCAVFATNYIFHQPNGVRYAPIINGISCKVLEGILKNYFLVASKSDPPLWTSAVAVLRQAIIAIGGFPPNIKVGEDVLTWAKLALNYEIAYSSRTCAIYYSTNTRFCLGESEDLVGRELSRMIMENESQNIHGLKEYAALWHKMRASVLLRLSEKAMALQEVRRAVAYAGLNVKLLIYACLALMPDPVSLKFTNLLNSINIRRRLKRSKLA